MTTPPRKPFYKRKRWIAAGVLWLVVAYPLSSGPALWLARHGFLPPPLGMFYAPIEAVTFPTPQPGFAWLRAYADWFASH